MFLVIDIVVLFNSFPVLTYCFLFLLSFPVIPLSLLFLLSFPGYSFLLFFSRCFVPVISFLLFHSCYFIPVISFLFFPFPLFSAGPPGPLQSASAVFRPGPDAAGLPLYLSICFLTSSLSQERVVPDAGSSSAPAGISSESSASPESPESAEKSSP